MKEAKNLFKIIKYFLEEKDCNIDSGNEEELYKLAKLNSVSGFLYNWSKKYCKSEKIKQAIKKDFTTQIIRDTNQNIELEKVLDLFEKNDIRTLLVKGSIIKDIYPQNYMREMCDIDIMVHDKDYKKAVKLMQESGYSKYYDTEKHLILTKKPFVIVELHRKLMLKSEEGYEYFKNIWSSCVNYRNYKNIYQLNLEDAYIFSIIHLHNHLKLMGIKLKDVLDIYLYNEKYKEILDYKKIDEKLNEWNIKKLENSIKDIAYKWFEGNYNYKLDDVEKIILNGITKKNRVNYLLTKKEEKTKVLLRLAFPKLEIMKEKYPILEKVAILLPVTWILRIFKDIFVYKISISQKMKTAKIVLEAKDDEVENVKRAYTKLGM